MDIDEARFTRIYEENWEDLLAYGLRRTASTEDAADLLAETFLVAWRKLPEVPPGDRARLWLFGVARRLLANQQRGELRRNRLSERLRGEAARALGNEVLVESERGASRALRRLERKDQEVLLLAVGEELKPAQIATVLGISAGNARSRLHRARRRFRRELEAETGCDPAPAPEWLVEETR